MEVLTTVYDCKTLTHAITWSFEELGGLSSRFIAQLAATKNCNFFSSPVMDLYLHRKRHPDQAPTSSNQASVQFTRAPFLSKFWLLTQCIISNWERDSQDDDCRKDLRQYATFSLIFSSLNQNQNRLFFSFWSLSWKQNLLKRILPC